MTREHRGLRHTPTYVIWANMRYRCNNPNHTHCKDYGGRGIRICERWDSFTNFLADMGERPPGMTLDRKDPDGNYEPGNCRWADSDTQAKNKRTTVKLTLNGVTMTQAEWGKHLGIEPCTIGKRLANGMSVEEALTKPSRKSKHRWRS